MLKPYFESPQVTLYHGDCFEVMPELEERSFDMVLCDLPYAVTQNHWDVVIPFEPLWEQYKRLIKPNGAIVLFGSQPFTSALVMSNPKWFKWEDIWHKTHATGHLNCKIQPLRQHENILVFGNGKVVYNPQITQKQPIDKRVGERSGLSACYGKAKIKSDRTISYSESYPRSVMQFSNNNGEGTCHPTQKPIALLQYLIKTYTNEGDRILDNTCGSGSTLVAARDTGRYAVGIEKEEKYCKITADRCSQLSIYSIA